MSIKLQAAIAKLPYDKIALLVDTQIQKLFVYKKYHELHKFDVSTSRYGEGNISKSYQTPLGLHEIHNKIGNNLPLNAILKGRVPTGNIASIVAEKKAFGDDVITTRILWLDGLEPMYNKGHNAEGALVDSYKRHIYIHGTSEEGLIGTKASIGCVRMRNTEVITLFDMVDVGCHVMII